NLHTRDAIQLSFPDVERNQQLATGLLPNVRRNRPAIALRAQKLLDASAGVFEQILVGRSFAFDRNELAAPVGRQWIAGKGNTNVRAGLHRQRDICEPVAVGQLDPGYYLRFVVPAASAVREISL